MGTVECTTLPYLDLDPIEFLRNDAVSNGVRLVFVGESEWWIHQMFKKKNDNQLSTLWRRVRERVRVRVFLATNIW